MKDPQNWKEGDTWTNERGVTFRLVPDQGSEVLVWMKQHYQIPQLVELAGDRAFI